MIILRVCATSRVCSVKDYIAFCMCDSQSYQAKNYTASIVYLYNSTKLCNSGYLPVKSVTPCRPVQALYREGLFC